jgi:chromosome segregation ATPase
MDTFYQQRNALNKNKQQENDQINKDLTDTQQSIEELQNSINSASNTLAEMQADAKTEEQNATQKVLKLMENTQQKIAAAQQKMQSNLQAIAQQNMNLNQKLNRLNNSLMTLGPAPSRGTEYSPAQAASDISTGVSDSLDLMQGNDTKGCFSEEKTDERLKNQYQKFNKGIQ